jgi:hypothetical protein
MWLVVSLVVGYSTACGVDRYALETCAQARPQLGGLAAWLLHFTPLVPALARPYETASK